MNSVKRLMKSPLCSIVAAPFAVLLSGYVQVGAAQASSQTTFPSAEQASHALLVAVENNDAPALTKILGQKNALITSNDEAQDELDRERFVHKYQEMHRLVRRRNGEVLLYIGAENWTFPIPLVSHNGVWRYDSDAGEKEVLYRRIGENELTAIQVCQALNATVTKTETRDDADHPVDTLLAAVKSSHKSVAFQGYYFRMLPNSGNSGFALLAYPAQYGSSGVMTFIADDKGAVYQKNLGSGTVKIATAMAVFHGDPTWAPAETGPRDQAEDSSET
ncbi:MAG TPA: DUF2950 family protein [Steroidobacteraceae bacterium]